jgi:aspartyl-tRNA(Asn)/glutamyl-tRNA(Gln) amidotransferase subunit C
VAVARDEVLHVARLARLRLTDEEIETFTRQLNGILSHVEELGAATLGSAEGYVAAEGAAPLRADRPGADPLQAAPAGFATAWAEGFFTVPRLPALDADAASGPGA